jgi:hypothetical protein
MRDQRQRAASGSRARQNWLTRHGRSIRWRTSRIPFTGKRARHVRERSASSHWSTYRHRSTHRNRSARGNRSTHRSAQRNRSTDRSTQRDRSSKGRRRSHRDWPRQGHRNPSHVSVWSAGRNARARCRSCTTTFTCRRLEAFVAAGWQRGGPNVRAQCHSDPAQPSPSSNYSDVESIKDRHRHQLLTFTFRIPHSIDAAKPHAVPKPRFYDHVNYQQPTSPNSQRHAPPFPNGDVRHGLTPVRHASVTQSRCFNCSFRGGPGGFRTCPLAVAAFREATSVETMNHPGHSMSSAKL